MSKANLELIKERIGRAIKQVRVAQGLDDTIDLAAAACSIMDQNRLIAEIESLRHDQKKILDALEGYKTRLTKSEALLFKKDQKIAGLKRELGRS